jgi:hypothetical protein
MFLNKICTVIKLTIIYFIYCIYCICKGIFCIQEHASHSINLGYLFSIKWTRGTIVYVITHLDLVQKDQDTFNIHWIYRKSYLCPSFPIYSKLSTYLDSHWDLYFISVTWLITTIMFINMILFICTLYLHLYNNQ